MIWLMSVTRVPYQAGIDCLYRKQAYKSVQNPSKHPNTYLVLRASKTCFMWCLAAWQSSWGLAAKNMAAHAEWER